MTSIFILATLSLAVQVVTLLTLFTGYFMKRKDKLRIHGGLMTVAVTIHIFSFAIVMLPAFLSLYQNMLLQKFSWLSASTILHVSLGGFSLFSGLFIAGAWHLQKSTAECFKRRIWMRYVFILWVTALVLGITVYTLLYLMP